VKPKFNHPKNSSAFFLLVLLGLALVQVSPGYAGDQEIFFTTADQVHINVLLCQGDPLPKAQLIIVAPGFAQHSGTRSMRTLAMALTATADVLIVDFRGNGKSEGVFTFGAKEYLDLEPVFQWSKKYTDVTLLGFSLGAYHSLCGAHAFPGAVQRLLLVSCPTCVEEIVSSGGAFLNPLALLFRSVQYRYPPGEDLLFRWWWPFAACRWCFRPWLVPPMTQVSPATLLRQILSPK